MGNDILIVFPHNLFELKSGIHKYMYDLVLYLNKQAYQVDLFALTNFESKWFADDPFDKSCIRDLYLYDAKKIDGFLRWKKVRRIVARKLGLKEAFPNFVSRGMKTFFDKIVQNNHYEYILVGYVFFSDLIKGIDKRITKIISINDFMTLQITNRCKAPRSIGHLLEAEINQINQFDVALCISVDELFFFSQFARNPKYYFVPFVYRPNFQVQTDCQYDLFFIGFNNNHNIYGLKWFLEKVYPKLDNRIRILIIGKIVTSFDFSIYKNITAVEYAPDLNKVYAQIKITISPLFGGSGLKTKVVESLSFGKPVVCTSKSIIGLPVKENNGCIVSDDPDEFANIIKKLLHEPVYYEECRGKAIQFFTEHFGLDNIYRTLDRVFEKKPVL